MGESHAFARDLAEFIRDVRGIETGGRTFSGGGRGGHLPDHNDWMSTCFERSEPFLDVAPLRTLWSRLRTLPRAPGPDPMTTFAGVVGRVVTPRRRLTQPP